MAMPPIRPSVGPPAAGAARPAADPARTAAQKAFFQAALGGEMQANAARPAQAARPVEAVQPSQRFTPQAAQRASIPDEAPTRMLRPGSFIDIKV